MVANRGPGFRNDLVQLDENMSELALLLPGWQAQALQEAAQGQGLSAGQFLRRLIDQALPRPEGSMSRLSLGGFWLRHAKRHHKAPPFGGAFFYAYWFGSPPIRIFLG